MKTLWRIAASFDSTLAAPREQLTRLARKRVHPSPFSRRLMFERMASGEISVFTGVKMPVTFSALRFRNRPGECAAKRLRQASPRLDDDVARPTRTMHLDELLDRWSQRQGLVSITDLHIRGTRLDRTIDTRAISDFNILSTRFVMPAWQEMLTMVSARGAASPTRTRRS